MRDPVRELAQEWLVRAVEFRYPDALPLMAPKATKVSVDTADRIYVFVVARLVQDAADSS